MASRMPGLFFRSSLMPGETAIDWNKIVFNGLTLKGI